MISTRCRAWLVAGAIFVCGALIGSAATAWLGARVLRHALRAPVGATSAADRAAARIGADLTRSLELTPEQSTRVQAILDASADRLKTIRVDAVRAAGEELRSSTAQIAATLPPEKRIELYRVIARRFNRLGLPPPTPPAP